MIVVNQIKTVQLRLSSILTVIQEVKDAYDSLQLFGVLKPNLYEEFYDLQKRLNDFHEALERLVNKSEENSNE